MLTGIHVLLTYQCNLECDHCFVYAGPQAGGTMELRQIRRVLEEARKIGTVKWIYFEGGEPFLYYSSLLQGLQAARDLGFEVGVVTNGYWATSEEDAEACLKPLAALGIADLSISDDSFHSESASENCAKRALRAGRSLGIPTSHICIEKPYVQATPGSGQTRGRPVIGGGALFRGRAVEKLTSDLPVRPPEELTECPYEDLRCPSRVHVDCFGYVHVCQGLSLGNMWERPLSMLLRDYSVNAHPICEALVSGGPRLLAERFEVDVDPGYVDECHCCSLVRATLIDRFPEYLGPPQIYGKSESNVT